MKRTLRRMLVVLSLVAVSTLGACLPDRNYGLIVISQQPVIENLQAAEIESQAGWPAVTDVRM